MSETKDILEDQRNGWRDKTIKAAGIGYLIGDAAFAGSGWIKGASGNAIFQTGAIWAAGGLGAALYGNPGTEKQLEILAHKLESYLKHHGAKVTDTERNNSELLRGKNGLGAKLDRFMHEHPTELLNTAYAIGAGLLLHKGIKNFAVKEGKIDAAMGALVLAGALTGLFIKEDPTAKAADPSSIISRTVSAVQQKPMRLSGALYWAGNIFTVANGFNDKKMHNHKSLAGIKPHYLSFLTAASYILANGMLALSSREQIREEKFKPEHLAQLEQVAAEIIAAQPPQLQAQLLTGVSEYLANERMVGVSSAELTKQLMARVNATSSRHLAQKTQENWAARTSVASAEAVTR
ncbi:MAG: hypothetical protein ACOYNL_06215 [Rickettsiales bacterium]